MKTRISSPLLALSLGAALAAAPAWADDIDIFTGASAGKASNPKILIVLDNTSNWARQSQQWPGGAQQGQSETAAISTVISKLSSDVNVGLFEFVVGGNANDNGGFVRSHILPMDATNKAAMTAQLSTISASINKPAEKRNSHTSYGNLMYDVYNYFAGANSYSPSAVTDTADARGYTAQWTRFKSPLSADEMCSKTYMVFIGNPNSSGPASDDAANTTKLNELNGDKTAGGAIIPVKQLGLPDFTTVETIVPTTLGSTNACYASNTLAIAAGIPNPDEPDRLAYAPFATECGNYTEGCKIGGPTSLNGQVLACAANTRRYTVTRKVKTYQAGTPQVGTATADTVGVKTSVTNNVYADTTAAQTGVTGGDLGTTSGFNIGTANCYAPKVETLPNGGSKTTTYACSYVVTGAATTPVPGAPSATTKPSDGCYNSLAGWNSATDQGAWTCPAGSTCSYSGTYPQGNNTSNCSSGQRNIQIKQILTPYVKYTIQRYVTATVVSDEETVNNNPPEVLGKTSLCYESGPTTATGDFAAECASNNVDCKYNANPTDATYSVCPAGTSAYAIIATNKVLVDRATLSTTPDTHPLNADEWARMMHDKGIPITGSTVRPSVVTYTIDVYNKQPNATHTSLLMSMANAGGGKYFAAKNQEAIVTALTEIVNEIQATNSSFASTSLPVNATNRSQSVNQVFIGMFRPDQLAKPRWFGNLKRYQLISTKGKIELGDNSSPDPKAAVNSSTGFITQCATSFWTGDSGDYWKNVGLTPSSASECTTNNTFDPYSDMPDGAQVEKGGAAQRLRSGNVPNTSTPTYAVNRKMYTRSGTGLVDFTAANTSLDSALVDFIRGQDVNNEKKDGQTTLARPSIHGDVIHSRPQPINYGDGGIVVYYGANDGALHAVDADTGVENWSFVAPEFFDTLSRLKDNTPLVSYPDAAGKYGAGTTRKDYFFDGSSGVYQNKGTTAADTKVWLYPVMRRGGRMIYGFDVSSPTTPSLKWAIGCHNLYNDDSCTTDSIKGIGQTWSTPAVAFLKGYKEGKSPVVIVGGGYDPCEDEDSPTPACSGKKGGHVYVIDADDGELLYDFSTERAVAADVSLSDSNGDGFPDFAYAADTGGNLYRISFVAGPTSLGGLAKGLWTGKKIAFTKARAGGTTVAEKGGRKFLFAPAVLTFKDVAYLAIGSGDREKPLLVQYPYEKVLNRFYVYRDKLSSLPAAAPVDLDAMANYTSNTTCDTPSVTPDGTLDGWFMDLNQYGKGEQTVTSALITGGSVTFSTNRPIAEDSASCATPLGEARGYWVSLLNASGGIGVSGQCGGIRSSIFVGGGLPPTPVLARSVKVGDDYVSVAIGPVPKDGIGAKSPLSPVKADPTVASKRKRTYTITSGD